MPDEPDYEHTYREFWAPIIAPNGVLDYEQVKRELADYSTFMDQASKVYYHITGGRISKVNTRASAVIDCFEDEVRRAVAEAIAEHEEAKEVR